MKMVLQGSWKALAESALVVGLCICSSGRAAEPIISVPAAETALHMAVPAPAGKSIDAKRAWRLVEVGQLGQSIPVDLVPALSADGAAAKTWRLAATIPPRTGATGLRQFQLESAKTKVAAAFRFADVNDKSLGLWEGSRPVLVYNHGTVSKEGVPTNFYRSTYVHPIYGLDGEVLTDDFPKDHYHHRGLFWAWPHVTIEGKETDLWACKGIYQRFERWLAKDAAAAAATLGIENGWYIENRKVVQERVWLRAYPTRDDAQVLDVELTWIPLDQPVTLMGAPGKSYGGLTLRYAPRTNTVITTTLGNENKDLPITHLAWADLSAQFKDGPKPSGAAVFIAPDHPDYPPEWLTRHYGVLCVGWPGVNAQTFPPGKPFRCRYRVWIHRGVPDKATVERAYTAYTAGEKARWK